MAFTLETTLSFAGQSNKWNTAGDAASVVEAIEKHPCLITLDLENNTLGPEAAKVIGDALAKHPEFKRAHFKDLFTGRLKTEIPLALRHLFSGINRSGAQLLELDLSDNALGPVGVEGMADFMCSPACYSLQELRLNNNGLGITGGTMLARSLEKLIENSNKAQQPWKLKLFIAGRNRLEKVGAKIFASIFRQLGSLEVLAMPQNGIFHEGIAALAEALSHNPSLRVLNLNDNTFTRKGAVAMAQHLPSMQALEVINFGDCLLKSAGAMALAVVLMPGHLKLRELYLDGNELTAEGALSVVEAVQNKPCLTTLMLDDNLFGEDGRDMIETFLKDVGKFEALGSMENNMEPDSGDEEDGSDDDDDDDQDTDEEESDDSPNEDFKPKDAVVLSKTTEKDMEEISSRLQNIIEKERDDTSQEEDLDIQVVATVNVAIKNSQEHHDSSVIVGPITPLQCTPEQYAAAPSAALLLGLPEGSVTPSALSHAAAITATTTTTTASTDPVILSPSQHISAVVQLLMQTAALAHTEDRQLLDAVHAAVRALATALFETARQHRLLSFTANTLLIHLGLIKTEDKSFAAPSDVRGALLCLEQVVKEDFFPRDISNTLEYFLSRPSPRLNAYPAEAERLRAALCCP